MNKKMDIGDIRVALECNDEANSYNVTVTGEGRQLERLEYPGDRDTAMTEYTMICGLLKKVAAIHKLI